jgi:hypothetical protein
MQSMRISTLIWIAGWVACSSFLASAKAQAPVSFNHEVRPILSDACFKCHGPDASNRDSEFRLDRRENALADLGGYFGIVPGDLAHSEVHRRIHSADDDQMPPPDALRQLSAQEKEILDRWIRAGAPFDGHWAFAALPREVTVPDVEGDWPLTTVDRFILATLQAKGFSPNREAEREKWLRRVTFDLTGLPPTLEEIDAFLQDSSDRAFEVVVDRLLVSDACAERLASEWLDVARYSDSYGYQRDDARFVWPWRDWVIDAFRSNMPYDQFITWQLAGDLLPNPTREQILATTFNRLHSHKKEGGVAVEEFRVENVADRIHTVAAAFMGLTLECARCHDHKYDPIRTKEYYQMSSFFANVDERGLISFFTDAVPTPAMPLPSPAQEAALAEADVKIRAAERSLQDAHAQAQSAFGAWLTAWHDSRDRRDGDSPEAVPDLVASLSFEELQEDPQGKFHNEGGTGVPSESMRKLDNAAPAAKPAVTSAANRLVEGRQGRAIELTGDDAVVLPGVGHYGRHQSFSVAVWINPAEVEERAVIYRRSRGWDDAGSIGYELTKEADRLSAKLAHFWPGNAICVETEALLSANQWTHVVVTYDGSSKAAGLRIFVNGAPAATRVVQDHLTRSITKWTAGHRDLAIGWRYRDRGFKDGKVDEFRVFQRCLSPLEAKHLFDGQTLDELRNIAIDRLSDAQLARLNEYYRSALDGSVRKAIDTLASAREARNAVMDSIPAITVMRERAVPRPTYVLTRGAYDQHGERVTADTPAFLPKFPADAPRNRLGLARWLTAPDHPLTARVTVNRYWQMLFGAGLVRTPEDFGNQGDPPSHPELLDWLARDFVAHQWDLRRLLRTLVLSATYRQSSVVSAEVRARDPENRYLARGPSQRLSAEMIRDNALAVSGLLVSQVGGPPVRPYDVALAYTPLPVDQGEGLYRRSLYTFWKRTSPSPVMMTLNATSREVCRLRRELTDSPLQALVLLNGAQFVEASRVLAGELLRRHGENLDAVCLEAYRRLTSRQPSADELQILKALYEEQLADFQAEPQRVARLLGTSDALEQGDPLAARHAAATVLVNSLMNLDESVRNP